MKKKMKHTRAFVAGLACLGLLGACSTNKMSSDMKNSNKSSVNKQSQAKDDKMKQDEMNDSTKSSTGDKMASSDMKKDSKLAPDFSLQGIDGKIYKLSDFKGKKIYLKFWASWCSICLSTLADTDDLAKVEGKDYVVLSVVAPNYNGEKSAEDFKKWYKSLDYKHLPVLLDSDGKIMQKYGIRSYPSAAFIASDGTLAKTHVGFMKKDEIEASLKEMK